MTIALSRPAPSRWPLTRMLVLVLAAGFGGLMMDIRVEHVEVVHEARVAWIPIIYSGLMAGLCFLAAAFWNVRARLVMRFCFASAFIVGGLGFYFHNRSDFGKALSNPAKAWTDPKMEHPGGPPQNAPMSFAGLGLLGALATFERFNRGD